MERQQRNDAGVVLRNNSQLGIPLANAGHDACELGMKIWTGEASIAPPQLDPAEGDIWTNIRPPRHSNTHWLLLAPKGSEDQAFLLAVQIVFAD
jgi:hypothetical protein